MNTVISQKILTSLRAAIVGSIVILCSPPTVAATPPSCEKDSDVVKMGIKTEKGEATMLVNCKDYKKLDLKEGQKVELMFPSGSCELPSGCSYE